LGTWTSASFTAETYTPSLQGVNKAISAILNDQMPERKQAAPAAA